MKQYTAQSKTQPGYAILLSVLIVGGVGLAIMYTIMDLSVQQTRTAIVLDSGQHARAAADACAEEALERLLRDDTYAAGDTLSTDTGECSISGILGSGTTNRTVQVVGTDDDVTKRLEIEIADIGPPMQIASWEEVASF